MKQKFKTEVITRIALMSVISYLLILMNVPLPMFPTFLKIDLSDVPSLLTAISMGPAAGMLVQLIKNLLHSFSTSTGGVGEIANFAMGTALILPLSLIYKNKKDNIGYVVGAIIGIITMTVCAILMNIYILFPLYGKVMGLSIESIIAMGTEVNMLITDFKTFVIFALAPFNILKGTITVLVSWSLYKYIKPVLRIEE